MPEAHYSANGGVDDHFFRVYRELLDAEDHAFDELEHAYEDGDRTHFEMDMVAWRAAFTKRVTYLERHGYAPSPLAI